MKFNVKIVDRTCLAVIILTVMFLGYLIVNKRIDLREKTSRDKAAYSGISNNLNNAQKDLEYLVSQRDRKRKILESVKKRIPDTPEVGIFLKTIDTLIRQRNISLESVNPQAPMDQGPYSRIPVQIILRGDFNKVYGLVYDLENMERLIVIDRLKVERSIKDKDCRAELITSIYSLAQTSSTGV